MHHAIATPTGTMAMACRSTRETNAPDRAASMATATPQTSEKIPPTNGFLTADPASETPARITAVGGAALRAAVTIASATSPRAYAIECCGTHQKHRCRPSTRRPANHQLLKASTLRFLTLLSAAPRCQRRQRANVPSALDATIARLTPAATGHALGSAVQAQRKMADTNSSEVPTALTFRHVCTSPSPPGAVPATAPGSRKYVQ